MPFHFVIRLLLENARYLQAICSAGHWARLRASRALTFSLFKRDLTFSSSHACDVTRPATEALQLWCVASCGGRIVMRNIAGLSSGPNGPGTLLLTGGRLVRNVTMAAASDFVSAA